MRLLAPRSAVPRLSRRAFLSGVAVVASGGLAGCGGHRFAPTARPDGRLEDRLNVFSWGDYDDPDNITAFREDHKVSVQFDAFASNEELIAKLATARGTSGYDIVVPTGDFVPMMVANGLLARLDHALLPNLANVDKPYRDRAWDPQNAYVVCKDWGTTGFVYDTTKITRGLTSWQDFLDVATGPASGSTSVLDDPFEFVSIYLAAYGHDLNTEDPAVLADAESYLVDTLARHIRNFSSQPSQNIIQGDFSLMQAYNGDVRLAIQEAETDKWRFVFPTPTANLWMDTWAIATGCEHPDIAHKFIDTMLDPEVGYREMDYIGYPTGLTGQRELAMQRQVDLPDLIFPPDDVLARLTTRTLNSSQEALVRILDRARTQAGAGS